MSPEKTLQVRSGRYFRKAKYGLDKFILIGKEKIHYVESGQGDPVILIPGSGGTFRAWSRLMPLMDRDYRMLALDYPVNPSSLSRPAGDLRSVRECAKTIIAIVNQLKLDKVKLIGWGFGGAVAFYLAARFADSVDKIVTVSWYITGGDETGATARLDWKKWGLKRNSRSDLMEEGKNIKQPLLYLYGAGLADQSSMSTTLQYLQNNIPQTWIIGLEGGIFGLLLKNPQEIASIITKFLRTRLEPDR